MQPEPINQDENRRIIQIKIDATIKAANEIVKACIESARQIRAFQHSFRSISSVGTKTNPIKIKRKCQDL